MMNTKPFNSSYNYKILAIFNYAQPEILIFFFVDKNQEALKFPCAIIIRNNFSCPCKVNYGCQIQVNIGLE